MKDSVNISFVKVLWVAGLIALGILSISAFNVKQEVYLKGITVDVIEFDGGDYFLTKDDVIEEVTAITGPVKALVLGEIGAREVEEALHFNPFIKRADVFVTSDAMLSVTVRQRQPIMRVFDKSGESYYVDKEGIRVPVSPHFTARVIVVNGDVEPVNVTNVLESEQLGRIHDLVMTIGEDKFTKSLIEQIWLNNDGSAVMIPKVGDFTIKFGHIERIREKLENLTAFYESVLKNDNWERYETLDLTYKGQVVCRKKDSIT